MATRTDESPAAVTAASHASTAASARKPAGSPSGASSSSPGATATANAAGTSTSNSPATGNGNAAGRAATAIAANAAKDSPAAAGARESARESVKEPVKETAKESLKESAGKPAARPAPVVDEKLAAARAKNLDLAISQIQKDYGEGAIMRLGAAERSDVDVIPTGNLLIDRALGVGGFPRGRIVEIYGPESSGKTTLTLTVIAQAQRAGGLAAFVDVEHALDPAYSRRLGVNLDDLLVSQPSSGEEALRIVETLVRSNALDVIVLDSVAALVTRQELEGEIGDSTVGAQARLMSAALRKLTALIAKARTCCIFTNQIREKIGVMFGSPETTPGGRALKFYSSVRCDIRRIGSIKSPDGTVAGNLTKLKVVKNKVAPPFAEAEFDIMYNEGISAVGSLLDLAIEHDILQKRGSWFSFNGTQIAQGRDAAKDVLKADDNLYAEIEAKVKEKLAPPPAKKA